MKTITYDETKWKLLPIEPTAEMLIRGGEDFFDSVRNWQIGSTLRDQDHAQMIYEAMLSSAPAPPTDGQMHSYTYHDHPTHPGYGWIEPIMDADCPLIEAHIAKEIAGLLNGWSASAPPAVEQIICPKCGVDRGNVPCPGDLMNCPIRGEAQAAVEQPTAQDREDALPDRDVVDLAREGMELHRPGQPEYIVCAELVRIADAARSAKEQP